MASKQLILFLGIIFLQIYALYLASLSNAKSPVHGIISFPSLSEGRDGKNNNLCFFTMTDPNSSQLRRCQREKCRPNYADALHLFVLGTPSYEKRKIKLHQQGRISLNEEVHASGEIINEQNRFRDILAVPYRDFSKNKSVKSLAALKHGIDVGCSYIIVVEDNICVNITSIRRIIALQKGDKETYFGYQQFNSAGKVRYLSGGYVGVSSHLASCIVNRDWTHSLMSLYHVKDREDAGLGYWVNYATKKHNLTVDYIVESKSLNEKYNKACSKSGVIRKVTGKSNFFKHDLCIVTLTDADFYGKRKCQRELCGPLYGNLLHRFAVGIPSYKSTDNDIKKTNVSASEKEFQISTSLIEEQNSFGDIMVTPSIDYYADLPEKRMAVLRFGVKNKCAYTIKVDEEHCVNVTVAKQMIAEHERDHPENEFYFGHDGKKSMQGPDKKPISYIPGWCNGASYKLAFHIVNEDWTHTVMRANNGSSSEDVVMGFWVDYSMKKHNLNVSRATKRQIYYTMPKDTHMCKI